MQVRLQVVTAIIDSGVSPPFRREGVLGPVLKLKEGVEVDDHGAERAILELAAMTNDDGFPDSMF